MSNITLEQEELAVIAELDDEKTVALVGGKLWELPKWELPKWELPAPPHRPSEKPCDVSISIKIEDKVNISIGT
ncbi:hypothetical protein BV378_31625 [Nostoc sp. RF31YmG]|jgi:hypothetical protein|nr:hypothetical protein BV378_31625 [Nostoc sp. RF31YmG]